MTIILLCLLGIHALGVTAATWSATYIGRHRV